MTVEPEITPTEIGSDRVDAVDDDHGAPRQPDARFGRAFRLVTLIGLIVLLGVTQGLSMLIVVTAIVVMIFLHELGHFLMARRAGMLVTEFFIGFGPRIWSFHRGETEYGIKAIPAGAYVKIVGMSSMEEVDPALEARTYRQGSFHQRLGVAVAGSAMHFLIALVLLFIQFAFIGAPDGDRWEVGNITPGSAAEIGGVQLGDEVVSFGGEPIASFEDFRTAITSAEPGEVVLGVVRDGEPVDVPIALSTRMKLIGTIGEDVDVVDNGRELLVGSPYPGGVAESAGIVGGTTLVEVNGAAVRTLADVESAGERSTDGGFTLATRDAGGQLTEHQLDLGSEVATTEPAAFVGVGSSPVLVTDSVPAAALRSGETFTEVVRASVTGIGRFLWPPNMFGFVADALGGAPGDATDTPTLAEQTPSTVSETRPISIVGIAMLGSDISSESISNLVLFLAQLNIFIGVFNLFPLLPFDGGHVVIACYEKLQEMRRRTGERYLADVSRMVPIATGVVIVLVTIGLLAIFVDITRGVNF